MVLAATVAANPFTERGRITDPMRFVGRWRELSLLFTRLEHVRPVLIAGPAGIGKSSLLTHVAQSAAVNLEDPELLSLYVDLSVLPDAETCYELIVRALEGRGNSIAALEVALLQFERPVLLCLDSAESAVQAGWGEHTLESLARVARQVGRGQAGIDQLPPFLLVAAMRSPVPVLSEPFTVITLGALTPTEIRLLIDAYLEGTEVEFSASDMRALSFLSAGHPAYLQRAAFHLFIAKIRPDYAWHTAYLEEARTPPTPGAPLPPAVFAGDAAEEILSIYASDAIEGHTEPPPAPPHVEGLAGLLAVFLLLLTPLLAWQISGNWLVAGGVLAGGIALLVGLKRWRKSNRTP